MTDWIDVTDKVEFWDNDGDYLPLTKCVCGRKFPSWDFILTTEKDMARECSGCGRKLYFENHIRVYAREAVPE